MAPEAAINDELEYVDDLGEVHRVYQHEEGRFFSRHIKRYTRVPDEYNNVFLYQSPIGSYQDNVMRVLELEDELEQMGLNNQVDLFRAGSGLRGTSGLFFRDGRIAVGDILVNTDITSFSENPYIAARFASSLEGAPAEEFHTYIFDDTSVVFTVQRTKPCRADEPSRPAADRLLLFSLSEPADFNPIGSPPQTASTKSVSTLWKLLNALTDGHQARITTRRGSVHAQRPLDHQALQRNAGFTL